MAYEIPGFKLGTLVAATDLSSDKYRFVTANTAGKVARLNTAGGRATGVLQSPAVADRAAEVMISGVTKMVAGAAIATIGETGIITSDNQGRVITAATGNAINGIALEPAAAAGEIITVLLGYRGVAP